MSLQRNLAASFGSHVYVALIGIVMVPMYVRHMGTEAYGLVGFFSVLQACFNLLDIGLIPTIARQSARFSGGAMDALSYRHLLRALEVIFLVVALLGTGVLLAASPFIAHDWLQASQLPPEQILAAILLMAPVIGMRWMAGLYRGAISGLERLVWLGGFNAFVATLRFVGVLPLLVFVDTTPAVFFAYQLGVALVELLLLVAYAYRLFPRLPPRTRLSWNWAPLKPLLKFSLMIAFTSSIGVLLVQTDKLVLSRILPLAEYGYFTLAVLVANGVLLTNGPISSSLLPRLVRLESEGNQAGLLRTYRRTTQLVSVVAGGASISIACCAESLLRAWTGDEQLARQAAPTLALYALGNGVFSIAAFPYYLQYAKGDLKLHVLGNAAFVVVLVPLIVLVATRYGAVGAGFVWLGMNLLSFVVWLPYVHRKFAPGMNRAWYGRDVGLIVFAIAVTALCGRTLLPRAGSGTMQAFEIAAFTAALFLAGAIASSEMRRRLFSLVRLRPRRPA